MDQLHALICYSIVSLRLSGRQSLTKYFVTGKSVILFIYKSFDGINRMKEFLLK